ncbi:MAG TPA: DUF4388 domain-containing protein [bacterium]|nr:DUF4388 domain-containing protein [bacterium]
MQIRGKLEDRSPADLLDWLHQDRKSGVLRFWRPGTKVRKDFWLENGEIVSSGTSEPREYLGSFLIAQGKITERDFVRAYREQVATKVLFGKVLVGFGLVTEREVEVALKEKTEESLWDVFLWRDGKYEFDDSATLSGQRLALTIDLAALIREGERRVIESGVLRQTLPHLDAELVALDSKADSPLDRRILEEIAKRKPPAEIALELRQSEFLFVRRVVELVKRGKVRIALVHSHDDAQPTDVAEKESVLPPIVDMEHATVMYAAGNKGETVDLAELKRRVPVLRVSRQQLEAMKFTPEEGYLLSRIDGTFDAMAVATLCPFQESIAFSALSGLAQRGIVALQKP